ncbi:hypothetical protein H9P43_008540 [Blastocladiella emersonii ATCC 22665]|nr:hypothetical protein H9P43_008540 [Blastocladiella emersonii ATCC 22665]
MSGYDRRGPPPAGNGNGYSSARGQYPSQQGGYDSRSGYDPQYDSRGGYDSRSASGAYASDRGYPQQQPRSRSQHRGDYPPASPTSSYGGYEQRQPASNGYAASRAAYGQQQQQQGYDRRGPAPASINTPPPPASNAGSAVGGRDRMAELRAAGVQRPVTHFGGNNAKESSGNDVTDFLDDVAELDKLLRRVRDDLGYISKCQRRAFDAVPEHQAQENKRELETVSSQTKSTLSQIRRELDSLDSALGALRKGTADYVMCANQLTNLKKNYQAQVQEFHQLETGFGNAQKDRLLREMRIVKADATEDDLEEYLNSGGQGGIFAQQVLHSSRYGEARRALRQVEDRQVEILKIEQMVEELAQLFLDLSMLVEQQDYTINQITEHVEEAVVEIERGEKEVTEAIEIRKNTIKWQWYACICVVIVIIVVIIYLFVTGKLDFIFNLFGGSKAETATTATPTPTPTAAKSLVAAAATPTPTVAGAKPAATPSATPRA